MRAIQKQDFGEDFQFRPQTSIRTAKLADKKRMSYQAGYNTVKIEEKLSLAQKFTDDKKEAIRARYEDEMKQKMPFKPQISPLKNRQGPLTARYREEQKDYVNQWDYLYMDSHRKNKNNKRDLSTDEAAFLRQSNEYTFQPNKDKRRGSKVKPSSKEPAQGADVDSFQINVNIGGEKKVIVANINSDPKKTARQFMRQHDIDAKYLETLTDLISDQ